MVKKTWRFGLTIALLGLFCNALFAQESEKHFRNISVDKGLSQSTVFVVRQDTLGFMWMGTQDGLNRYDGKRFVVYRPQERNPKSLQSYLLRSLFIDSRGRLWTGGNKGISLYSYATDDFVNYKVPRTVGEWFISGITEDSQHNMWAVSTGGDIFKLTNGSQKFEALNFDAQSHGIKRINYIGMGQGRILVGTDVGLFRLDSKTQKLYKIAIGFDKLEVNDVLAEHEQLKIGTEGKGLITLNTKNGKLGIAQRTAGLNSLVDNNVRSICKDVLGNYWLGTFRGLSIYNPTVKKFQNYTHQPAIPFTISQNSVRTIFRDKQNGIWLGTYYGGINYYHKNDINFNFLGQNTGQQALNDGVVCAIAEDEERNMWIGTNDRGINFWNRKTNKISYITYNESSGNSLATNNIKALILGPNGDLLIGTHNGGLNVLNRKTGKISQYLHNDAEPKSIAGNLVYSLLKDSKNRIWVGTRSGLDQFLPQSKTFKHIYLDSAGKRLNSDEITCLFQDSKQRIWIGTTNGVTQFYPDNKLFSAVNNDALADEMVNCIAEDAQHRIWVGTRGGLSLYDEKKNTFITYQQRKDFKLGNVYGLLPDGRDLWASTNKGLVRYTPQTHATQFFNQKDGIQNNQFNPGAFCRTKDGAMFFGGISGISYFYPSLVKQSPLKLQVKFTGLDIFNQKVVANDATGMLKQHLDQATKLSFGPESKQFSVYFNSFNYMSANRTHYRYKLEGLDQAWQKTDDPKVTYNNLPAGSYQLLIKAVGPNGEQSAVRSLKIRILPPWYKSSWFFLLLAVLAIAGIFIAYRIISERLRTLHQLKIERSEKEKVRYINQVKMEFFTNVSHELRTPLTLILAPLEDMLRKPSVDKTLNKQHELMYANAKRLYNLVDQLFEFKKTELGTRKLKVQQGDMVSFIGEVYESFKPLSEKNRIRFALNSQADKLAFPFDRDAMERILFNLLSNAFKYTRPGDSIAIDLATENDFVLIKVVDTGLGINDRDVDKIFDRFYQVDNKEMNLGSGVGLAFTKRLVELHHGTIAVSSKPGKGTVFTLQIPLSPDFYAHDTKANQSGGQLSYVPGTESEYNAPEPVTPTLPAQPDAEARFSLLVVDDNPEIVDYLSSYFSAQHHVLVAYDGKQALHIAESQPVDIIISDVMMPQLDGLHFCKKMKQNINTSHIPIILLTAKGDIDQQIKGFEMGADDYMTKPFSTQLLEAKIANLLRSRRRLKEFYSSNKEMVPENIAFSPLDEEFLRSAVDIIESHLSDSDFSVDKFSREIGMSRSNLYLKLKAITGESANDFVKRIRFNKAVELMQSKRYTMAQITYMCGFNSPSYFSTAFKQYFGCIPTEYLTRLANNEDSPQKNQGK